MLNPLLLKITGGLAGLLLLITLVHDRNHWKRVAADRQAQLAAITKPKAEQKVVTRDRIKVVTQTIRVADDRAKAIETAPLPGNCRTPDEVLHADI